MTQQKQYRKLHRALQFKSPRHEIRKVATYAQIRQRFIAKEMKTSIRRRFAGRNISPVIQ
jgi:hypothetical protein